MEIWLWHRGGDKSPAQRKIEILHMGDLSCRNKKKSVV